MDDLVKAGTMTPDMVEFLKACVKLKLNILISGGTGTGKTTFLNALSAYIPETERIVTIEDPIEIKLQQPHVVAPWRRGRRTSTARARSAQRDLLRNSLRMRPDRIIIGEVRGSEAFDMLNAMNTGHEGSLSTVHANAPRDALARIENMVLMANLELPDRAIREQMASALDLIVQLRATPTACAASPTSPSARAWKARSSPFRTSSGSCSPPSTRDGSDPRATSAHRHPPVLRRAVRPRGGRAARGHLHHREVHPVMSVLPIVIGIFAAIAFVTGFLAVFGGEKHGETKAMAQRLSAFKGDGEQSGKVAGASEESAFKHRSYSGLPVLSRLLRG